MPSDSSRDDYRNSLSESDENAPMTELEDFNGEFEEPEMTKRSPYREIFHSFLPLGFTAFGGPQAHISILLEQFVVKRKWLDERMFSELLGLGQGLPGPTSTQMVFALGASRGGILGGFLSFILFSFPGFVIMTLAGLATEFLPDSAEWLLEIENALAASAVGLVAFAANKLGTKLIQNTFSLLLMVISASLALLLPYPLTFPVILVLGGLASYIRKRILDKRERSFQQLPENDSNDTNPENVEGRILLITFFLLLGSVLLLHRLFPHWKALQWFELMYRMGSLIYGGGQVLLPMLLTEMVEPGWITQRDFFNGFALIQALPGPMFNFSAFLGARVGGLGGAFIFWAGLFLPGLLVIGGTFPFWMKYRSQRTLQVILDGVNAAAIGLVVAAVFMLANRAIHSDPFLTVVAMLTFTAVSALSIPAPLALLFSGVTGFFKWMVL